MTLLEVMVAFLIAALAVGALTQGAGSGLQAARVAGHTQEALARAGSHLAAASLAPAAGVQSGDDGGGFRWAVTTTRLAVAAPPREAPDQPRPALYAIRVTVSWTADGGAREVSLDTQRVGLMPPEAP